MNISRGVSLLAWLAVVVAPAAVSTAPESPTVSTPSKAFVDTYCVTCHNQRAKTAGLFLDTMDVTNVGANAEAWEKVVVKLRAGLMPPSGVRRQSHAEGDCPDRAAGRAAALPAAGGAQSSRQAGAECSKDASQVSPRDIRATPASGR